MVVVGDAEVASAEICALIVAIASSAEGAGAGAASSPSSAGSSSAGAMADRDGGIGGAPGEAIAEAALVIGPKLLRLYMHGASIDPGASERSR